ncbi:MULTISPECIES: WYL domain-containing protein [Brevibacterium]|uniref:Predicted DNA-binding transcriptional regulator YafY, contains an HTH and WYL domains n=1 Tax=Brevibacterium antiquum CNRZ 918 TaxID=1255637 RepID=A0A2H1HR01_9MICO|nr:MULTISPECIES: WYL domain-containing protein [Brevibacterium]SMX65348.1 Predicted DNA-binding transcriptional regulator YafY, contains an HTH and WYL domains [Brevibacterium antiquum CNRZ 918]
MKAARLVSEIVILGARSVPITAESLANRLEVTQRTVYRDLGDLSRMGVPVVTESGPGGGISLLGSWTTPLSGMTRDELDSVLIGGLAAADLGFSAELATAREKILSETDSVFSSDVLVDGPDWFMKYERPEELSVIVAALRSHRGLRFDYASGAGSLVRTVIPLGLVVKAGRWYLAAQPPGGRPRTYRVSRIAEIRLRYVSISRPEGFHLGDYWTRSQTEFDRSIRSATVKLRIPSDSLGDLRRAIPGRVTDEAIESGAKVEGRYVIDLPMEPPAVAVSQLITVPGVEVISPREIRVALHERARQAAVCNGL